MSTTADAIDPTYLHDPSRRERLRPLREHLDITAGASRALWTLLRDGPIADPRDIAAVVGLVGLIADHASAADAIVRARGSEADGW